MRSVLLTVALAVALPMGAVARAGTLPASLCDMGRQSHCRSAGTSRLLIKNSANDAKDSLTWQWRKGAATTFADLGVPTDTTPYALCIYAGDSTAAIAEADIAASATLWHPAGKTGFAYRDPSRSSDGVRNAILKSGAAGKASAVVQGRGVDLSDPPSGPFPLPVTVQLVHGADDACFEAVYDSAVVKRNDAEGFDAHTRARSLYVSASGALDGKGSVANPYRRITDAVARARAERAIGRIPLKEAIQIHVAPGTYVGSFSPTELQSHPDYEILPIILDVPHVALIGSTALVRDDRGLPTATKPGTETILEPDVMLRESQHLFLATRTTNGGVGDRVTVEGFALDGKYEEGADLFATVGVYLDRVSGFRVRNNLIHRTTQGVLTRLASGAIEGNLMTDNRYLGSLVSGGSLVHPATVLVYANRSTGNLHGFGHLASGYANVRPDLGQNTLSLEPLRVTFDRNNAEDVPQIPDTLTVTVSGNDASDNVFSGIRLAGIFHDFDYDTAGPAQPVTSTLSAAVTGNTCERNGYYGVLIEASRIPRSAPREFNQTIAASFRENTVAGNASAPALVTFVYWGTSAGWPAPLSFYTFPTESTFQLTDPNGELAGFDYDHPVTDPISGAVLDNVLVVNGVEAPHGTKITPP